MREISLLRRTVDERTANLQLEIDRINRHLQSDGLRETNLPLHAVDDRTANLQLEIDRINRHVHEWLEERHRIVPLLVTLRSDTASVANREALLADDFNVQKLSTEGSLEQISRALAAISVTDREHPRIAERLDRLEREQLTLRSDVASVVNREVLLADDFRVLKLKTEGNLEQISGAVATISLTDREHRSTAGRVDPPEAEHKGIRGGEESILGERAESAERVDKLMARFSERSQDALFRALLPLAEVRADFAVLRTFVGESMASHAQVGARVEALERQKAVVDSIAALQAEQATNLREVEWRSRLYLRQTNNGLFALKRGELISDFVASGQIWDPHVLNVAHEVSAQKGGTAVDVGAHFGFMTAGLARLFDRVVSFEPNDFIYSILKANIALNGLTNVECHHTALYSRECDISLGRPDQQEIAIPLGSDGAFDGTMATNLGALSFTENGSGIFGQRARTLDSYRLENVTFLKLDTQGAEGEILFGCIDTLRRSHPVVVFEREEALSRNFTRTFADVLGMLAELGYSVDLLHRTNEKQADYVAR